MADDIVTTLEAVQTALGRTMPSDEVMVAGKLIRAGHTVESIVEFLGERPADIADEDVPVDAAVLVGYDKRRPVFRAPEADSA